MSFHSAKNPYLNYFNNYLDKLVRPEFHMLHRSWFSFQFCGYTGLVLAILLTMTLTLYLGLSLWVMSGVIGTSILTFLGLAMITKIITGEERLVYYHHEIAIMVVAAVFLKIISQPVFPYLDVLILGIGMFLVCGRVGCLMVGCCHGRPNQWGVCYRKEHAAAGFTNYYVGIRLFPVQALESLWVFGVILAGIVFILGGRPSGETLAWYVITYDIGRFCFEFVRGDPARSYHWGFSEAQWTSIVLMCVVVLGELAGTLPFHLWHIVATAGLLLTMLVIALNRKFQGTLKHQLLLPGHIKEVSEAVDLISNADAQNTAIAKGNAAPVFIPMSCTSLGIQISAGKIHDNKAFIDHYTFSSKKGSMSKETAGTLADLIIQLKHFSGSKELVMKHRGVFHLLIHPLTARGQK
jgi:prolipoprotein diacylglyceryltransferase